MLILCGIFFWFYSSNLWTSLNFFSFRIAIQSSLSQRASSWDLSRWMNLWRLYTCSFTTVWKWNFVWTLLPCVVQIYIITRPLSNVIRTEKLHLLLLPSFLLILILFWVYKMFFAVIISYFLHLLVGKGFKIQEPLQILTKLV